MRDLIIAQAIAIMLLICGTAFAGQSYLVGDLGIIKPDLKGILIAQDKPLPFVVEHTAVIDRTEAKGEVTVTMTEAYYNGEPQTVESMENAGFFSIVTSKDM